MSQEIAAAIITGSITLLAALLAAVAVRNVVRQLRAQQDQANRQQAEANKRPFLEKQLEICIEASDVVSRLATETGPERWEKVRATFWHLYWGRLALVEDREVEDGMKKFGELLPKGPVSKEMLPLESLELPSLRLAHTARNLILRSWNVELEPLRGEEPSSEEP